MVTIVTPNFTHCAIAEEAFANGRHVLVENAMCLNVAEAGRMVEASKRAGKMLCVHHNRRHDGNYRLIREIVDSGQIGEIFHIELTPGQFLHPFAGKTDLWWANRKLSGGGFFYYGAQAIDWILDLVPAKILNVTGFCQKRVWKDMSFDDEVMAIIRFDNGVYANFCESHIRAAPQPFWRILGTKGAIVDSGKDATKGYEKQTRYPSSGHLSLYTVVDGGIKEQHLPYKDSDWDEFYQDIVRHLHNGGPVPISGEVGRRVMSVLETAKKSCESGQAEVPPFN
jgi:predicted dehydrogenase